jgi:putative ABC transport system permease protein
MSRGESFQAGKTKMTDVIINERFAQVIGRPEVVGLSLSSGARNLRILGVVKDFNFMPVDRTILPILIFFDPTYRSFQTYQYLFIRLHPGNVAEAISFLRSTVQRLNPGFPFEYNFLDDDYDQRYRAFIVLI